MTVRATREEKLIVYTTRQHKRAIEAQAERLGMKISTFIRLLLQEACPAYSQSDPTREELLEAQRAVGALGGRQALHDLRGDRRPLPAAQRPPEAPSASQSSIEDRTAELIAEGRNPRVARAIASAEQRQRAAP